jgi:hypothetical protein
VIQIAASASSAAVQVVDDALACRPPSARRRGSSCEVQQPMTGLGPLDATASLLLFPSGPRLSTGAGGPALLRWTFPIE